MSQHETDTRLGLDAVAACRDSLLALLPSAALLAVLAGSLATGPWVHAQTPVDARFEVTSVKRNPSGNPGMTFGGQPTVFVMTNGPIASLIQYTYPSARFDLVGAPDWLSTERYDVRGTTAAPPSIEELRAMLRALLADRFQMVAHYETRERPVLRMVVDRRDGRLGPAMRRSDIDCAAFAAMPPEQRVGVPPRENGAPTCGMQGGGGQIMSGGLTMAIFSRSLAGYVGRVVVDSTGLEGAYEFTLRFSATQPTPNAGGAATIQEQPEIFTALREQLGLRLEPAEAPLEVLVIDHIERPMPD